MFLKAEHLHLFSLRFTAETFSQVHREQPMPISANLSSKTIARSAFLAGAVTTLSGLALIVGSMGAGSAICGDLTLPQFALLHLESAVHCPGCPTALAGLTMMVAALLVHPAFQTAAAREPIAA